MIEVGVPGNGTQEVAIGGPRQLPDRIPVLPLREAVTFPELVVPLNVGQERSVELVNDVLRGDRAIVLLAGRDPSVETPTPEQLYEIGVLGTVAVGAGSAAAGVLVTVIVLGVGAGPVSPASFTSAAASTPSESTATTIAPSSGVRQFGDAASRVRAAAPQRRHHSCSGCSGAPHSGQLSLGTLIGGGAGAGVAPGPSTGAVARLTCPRRPDE